MKNPKPEIRDPKEIRSPKSETRRLATAAFCFLFSAFYFSAHAQGTAFTYQGRLNDGPDAASGIYDLRFTIYDSASVGGLVAGPLTSSPTGVSNGLFTVTLDFGPDVFTGPERWLEIAVRTNGGGAFSTLTPRTAITPTPYALHAQRLSSDGLVGTFSGGVTLNNPANTFVGAFTGDGTGLTNVNAAMVGGLSASNFWQLGGNSGTTVANFVGTTDNQPLELRVNGERAFRLEPSPESPNIIGGAFANNVAPGVRGATIAGGGLVPFPNAVTADFATIGGGTFHVAGGSWSTIGGGRDNRARAESSTVAGGWANQIETNSLAAFIGGGRLNHIASNSVYTTIGGGQFNRIGPAFNSVTISGGEANYAAANHATVSGGLFNTNTGPGATISGGNGNLTFANDTAIGGGFHNAIVNGSFGASIGGGRFNYISFNSPDATIGGGIVNTNSGVGGTIGGGQYNTVNHTNGVIGGGRFNSLIGTTGDASVIAGGAGNYIMDIQTGTIGGGLQNHIIGNSAVATIGGGYQNFIEENGLLATIGGGFFNFATASYSTISGGYFNTNSGSYATVPGGAANRAAGDYSFAAGRRAKANHTGAFVWADSTDADFASTGQNQFLVRASGGVGINQNNPTAKLHVGGTPGVDGIRFPDGTLQTTAATPPPAAPQMLFLSGQGSDPAATNNFLAAPVTVIITSSAQRVLVTSHKAFGSAVVGGANGLNLFIGYRLGAAGAPAIVGEGILGNQVTQNNRVTMGLSAVISGLAPGTYQMGLVGRCTTTPANWNSNEYSYTTALVH